MDPQNFLPPKPGFHSLFCLSSSLLHAEDIFRRMFHIDKFQNLSLITGLLQIFRSKKSVCQTPQTALLKTIIQNRRQLIISGSFPLHLPIQFMLTAWNRQDDLRIPSHRFGKCKICRCITGMKRHNHIHFSDTFIIRDISNQKFQFVISIFAA